MTAEERLAKTHEMRREFAEMWGASVEDVSISAHGVSVALWPLPQPNNGTARVRENNGGLQCNHKPEDEKGVGDLTMCDGQSDDYAVECSECKRAIVCEGLAGYHELDYAAAAGIPILREPPAPYLCPACEWNQRGAEAAGPEPLPDLPDCPYEEHEYAAVGSTEDGRYRCHICNRFFTADAPAPDWQLGLCHECHETPTCLNSDYCKKCELKRGAAPVSAPTLAVKMGEAAQDATDLDLVAVLPDCPECGEMREAVVGPDGDHEFYCATCDVRYAVELCAEEHSACPVCGELNARVAFGNGAHFTCLECGQQWSIPPGVFPFRTKRAEVEAPSQAGGAG